MAAPQTYRSTPSKDSAAEKDSIQLRTVRWLALAELRHGMTGCVLVRSEGTKVLSYTLLAVGQDPGAAESAWEDAAYYLIHNQDADLPPDLLARAEESVKPYGPEDVLGAWGYALERERPKSGLFCIFVFRTEGAKVIDKALAEAGPSPDYLTSEAEYYGLAFRNLIRTDRRPA